MSDSQAKLLALVRQSGGEIEAYKIPTFRYRSVLPLVVAGYLRFVGCGQCPGCEYGRRIGEDDRCDKLRIRTVN